MIMKKEKNLIKKLDHWISSFEILSRKFVWMKVKIDNSVNWIVMIKSKWAIWRLSLWFINETKLNEEHSPKVELVGRQKEMGLDWLWCSQYSVISLGLQQEWKFNEGWEEVWLQKEIIVSFSVKCWEKDGRRAIEAVCQFKWKICVNWRAVMEDYIRGT